MSRETAGVDKNIAAKVALLGLPVMLPLHVPLQVPGGVETKNAGNNIRKEQDCWQKYSTRILENDDFYPMLDPLWC